jgi:hypothetical protein
MKNRLKIYLGYLFSLLVIAAGVYALVYEILWENSILSKVSGIVGGIYLILMGLIVGPLLHTCVDLEHNISEDKESTVKEETLKAKAFDIIVRKHVNIKGFIDCANYVEYNVKYGGTILTYLTNDEFKLINMLILDKVVGDFADVLRRS